MNAVATLCMSTRHSLWSRFDFWFVGFTAIIWLTGGSVARGAFHRVTSTADSGPGSLRQAMLNANGNQESDQIVIEVEGVIELASPLPDLTFDAEIKGLGPERITISGSNKLRPLTIPFTVEVVLSGVTLSNGLADQGGGGAIQSLGSLTLTNCAIARCRSLGEGGGAVFSKGSVQAFRSTFNDNQSNASGGAIRAGTFLVLEDCSFDNNRVIADDVTPVERFRIVFGGAIAFEATHIEARNTRFTNNLVTANPRAFDAFGGAIAQFGNYKSFMSMSDCIFEGNAAFGANVQEGSGGQAGGGAVYLLGLQPQQASFIQCRFEQNQVIAGTGPTAGVGQGGGIHAGRTLLLAKCSFVSNSAQGALAFGGGVSAFGLVSDCLFERNEALDFGSGASQGGGLNGTSINVSGTAFYKNRAKLGGGAHLQGVLVNSTWAYNDGLTGRGGGLFVHGASSIQNCTLANNRARLGGGIFVEGGTTTLSGTLVGQNLTSQGAPDVSGIVISLGFNLIHQSVGSSGWSDSDRLDVDPGIGLFGLNGGLTPAFPLLSTSIALNAGSVPMAPATDQRGMLRSQTDVIDIGAYEVGPIEVVVDGQTAWPLIQRTNVTEAIITLISSFPEGSIFFTLDGSEPTPASTLYSRPFVVDRGLVVRALYLTS